jgi:xylan 1,4-beta-xylosidase
VVRADILADSSADFSGVQGGKNWYYGYFPAGDVYSFTQLPYFNSSQNEWMHTTCCPPWTVVGSYSVMHPNGTDSGAEEWAVREWISTFNGPATISGKIYKADTNPASPGVFGKVYVNHVLLWNQFIGGTDGVGVTYSLPVTLAAGDVIDFALAPNGADYSDSTIFAGTITSVYSPVSVDFAVPLATNSGSGFLHAITTTSPPAGDVTPLRPQFWRIPANLSLYQAVRSFAPTIPIHLNISDVYGYPGNNYNGNGPPWTNFTAYETFVRNTVAPFQGATNVIFDVWNEADDINFQPTQPGYQSFWNGTIDQFYETYLHTWNALVAELGPNIQAAGPTYTAYDHAGIQAFLDYCVANGCQVNSLTWHALNDYSDPITLPANVQDAQTSFEQNPDYAALHMNRIDINEMIGSFFWHQPGGTLRYFQAFEQSGATNAARTCGFDDNSQCSNGTLNGLLTAGTLQPLGVWWLQKYYADGAAARVQGGASNSDIAVLASNGAVGAQPAQVLIGYADVLQSQAGQSSTVSVQLNLAHAGPSTPSQSASSVGLRIEHIPDTGTAPLAQIEFVEDISLPLIAGAGTATLPPLPLGDAFRVTLLNAQTVSFGGVSDVYLGTPPLSLTAVADSGLPVSFASTTPSVCAVSGVTVTPNAVGLCSISASQAGNNTYAAANPVAQTFAVLSLCDLNRDRSTNVADVRTIVNEALGAAPATGDLDHSASVNVVDVQIVINAALELGCAAQ